MAVGCALRGREVRVVYDYLVIIHIFRNPKYFRCIFELPRTMQPLGNCALRCGDGECVHCVSDKSTEFISMANNNAFE